MCSAPITMHDSAPVLVFCSRITVRYTLYFPQLCFSHICLPHVRPICNFAVQLSLCLRRYLSISAYLWTKLGSHMCNVLGLCLRLDSCSKNLRRVCFYRANKRWSILCYIKHLFAFYTDFSRIFQPRISCAVFSSPAFSRPAFWCHIFQSRIFQPCSFVPYFPFLHFPALHFTLCRIFMSRIFSRPAVSSKRAKFDNVQFFLQHIPKLIIFGMHNMHTFKLNTLIN